MDNFVSKYTTNEKVTEDLKKPEKDQTERGKTILSNDAFALGETLIQLINKLEQTRCSFLK